MQRYKNFGSPKSKAIYRQRPWRHLTSLTGTVTDSGPRFLWPVRKMVPHGRTKRCSSWRGGDRHIDIVVRNRSLEDLHRFRRPSVSPAFIRAVRQPDFSTPPHPFVRSHTFHWCTEKIWSIAGQLPPSSCRLRRHCCCCCSSFGVTLDTKPRRRQRPITGEDKRLKDSRPCPVWRRVWMKDGEFVQQSPGDRRRCDPNNYRSSIDGLYLNRDGILE
jgi:hypothetical protein